MKKETEKKTKKKKEDEKELEEQISEEESELENKIEETESTLDKNKLLEFVGQSSTDIPPVESFSPVLEKVHDAPIESLESDVSFVSTSAKDDDKKVQYDITNYDENYARASERDIDTSVEESRKIRETFSVGQPAPINLETVGRDFRATPRQVDFVNPEVQNQESEVKYVQPERIDMEKVGREKVQSRKVQKYETR